MVDPTQLGEEVADTGPAKGLEAGERALEHRQFGFQLGQAPLARRDLAEATLVLALLRQLGADEGLGRRRVPRVGDVGDLGLGHRDRVLLQPRRRAHPERASTP